jgi:hypothetical protein
MRDYETALRQAAKDSSHLPEEPVKPITPHIIFEDVTAQSLVKRLEGNQPSAGLFSSEGGKLTGGYAMSDKGKTHSAGVFNTLWDDGSADRWRSGEEEGVRLRGRRLSAHIMLQPGVASEFLADRSLADQGFLARWLVTAPESIMGFRPWQEPRLEDEAAIEDFGSLLRRLLGMGACAAPQDSGHPSSVPELPALKLSMDARTDWVRFHDEVEAELIPGGSSRPIAGFAAKLAEQTLRIAGVLTVVERPAAGAIGGHAMLNAIALGRYYLSEALRLHGAEPVAADLQEAAALLERLQAKWPQEPFSIRDVLTLNISTVATSRKVRSLLNELHTHGLVTVETVSTRTKPGERWRIAGDSGD